MTIQNLRSVAIRFLQDESGPTATEYAVMLALILIAVLGSVTTLGTTLSAKYSSMTTTMFP